MKTLIISICCFLCFTALSTAQEQSLNEFIRDCHHRDGIKHFTIPGFLVRFAGNIILNDEDKIEREAIRPLLRNIGGVSILVASDGGRIRTSDLNQLKSNLLDENYEPLVAIKDQDTRVEIFSWEKKDITRRLVFLIHDEDEESLIITLRGYFTEEDLSKLIDHYKNKENRKRL